MTATKTETNDGLHMLKMRVKNFLKIELLSVDAEGQSVIFNGRNGTGKSSALLAFWTAIGGLDTKVHPEPIHGGAEAAELDVDLGDIKIRRVIKVNEKTGRAETDSLSIIRKDGSKVKAAPQNLLNSLMGKFSMDPIAFLGLRPQDQVDIVLKRAGVEPPVDEVEQITGKKHPARTGESASAYLERLSADDTGLYYIERTAARRVLTEKENAVADQQKELETLGGALTEDEEPGSVAEVLQKISDLQQQAKERGDALSLADQAVREHASASTKLEGYNAEAKRLREQLAKVEGYIDKGTRYIAELAKTASDRRELAESLTDPSEEIAELTQKVEQHEASVKAVRRRQSAMEQVERLQVEKAQADAVHRELDATLGEVRDLRRHLLDGTKLDVPGLSIDAGMLRLNNRPLTQASQSEQIDFSLEIAMDPEAKIKVLPIDDMERLDSKRRQHVLQKTKSRGWQVLGASVEELDEMSPQIVAAEG